jgi:type VI secretion system protein
MLLQLSRMFRVGTLRHGSKGVTALAILSLAPLCLTATSCAKRKLAVRVAIEAGANGNTPVALDIVRVNDKDLVKELSKLTAADWFAKRDQYQLDYPKPGELSITSGEWVPGQAVPSVSLPAGPPIPIPFLSSKATTLVFANYFTLGPHRAELEASKGMLIDLGENDLKIVGGGGKSLKLPEKK